MIRALSPYYIDTDLTYTPPGGSLTTCESFTLNIWVWDGDKNSLDSTNSYQVTYQNTSDRTDSHKINISPMVRDYIDFTQPTSFSALETSTLLNGNNQQWVHTFVTYDDNILQKYNESTQIMTLGYSYGMEGVNFDDVSNNTLIIPQEYKANKDGIFIFPVLASEASSRVITINKGISSSSGDIFDEAPITFVVSPTTESSEIVKYLWLDIRNDFPDLNRNDVISITYNNNTTTLVIEEECKYSPMSIMFQNKDGALQSFTFFKEQIESISVTDESFETNRGQASDGHHQFVRYNVQARTKVKASSGFLHERENENIKQMLLSERIWLYNRTGPYYTPVNISSTSVTYKTRIKERLINYVIEFEMGYNELNNI